MIPLYDELPTKKFPIMTVLLILINVAVFIYELSLGPALDVFVARFGLIPYEITHFADLPPQSLHPILLTIFTSMFLHGSFFHIFGNMLYFWIFGNNVEDVMGPIRFLVFYILCGISAAFSQILLSPNSQVPMIGASGAISGVLAAYFVLFPYAKVYTLFWFFIFIRIIPIPAFFVLGFWFLVQLISGISSLGMGNSGGVAWFVHIGGFIAGLLLVNIFKETKRSHYYHDYYYKYL